MPRTTRTKRIPELEQLEPKEQLNPMKVNRAFKGVWIPKEIYLRKDLSWTEKLLFIEINSLDGEDGCYASNKYFSGFLGVSVAIVSAGISKLVKIGLVERVSFDGKKRVLTTQTSLQEKLKAAFKKSFRLTSNNTNNVLTKVKTKSKRDLTSSKYVDYWNSLPRTSKHKNPSTKTYQSIIKKIRSLQSGTFNKTCRIDPAWLEKRNISKRVVRKKYTDEQIKQGIQNVSLLLQEGYWPEDKSKLPKSLDQLLYNKVTRSSFFLIFLKDPPKLLADLRIKDTKPQMTKSAIQFLGKNYDESERSELIWKLKTIIKDHKKNQPYLSPVTLLLKYIEYLEDTADMSKVSVAFFSATSWSYRKFVRENYNLY